MLFQAMNRATMSPAHGAFTYRTVAHVVLSKAPSIDAGPPTAWIWTICQNQLLAQFELSHKAFSHQRCERLFPLRVPWPSVGRLRRSMTEMMLRYDGCVGLRRLMIC
jgi:hypothetical protein